MRYLSISLVLLFLFTCFCFLHCNAPTSKQPESTAFQDSLNVAQCIKDIFALDDSLGSVRNHACETIPLSETIITYTTSLKGLDFQHCPEAFTKAFKAHWQAWDAMLPVVNEYPDLRGEMHDLFDQIEASSDSSAFKLKLKAIWDTWGVIEEHK